ISRAGLSIPSDISLIGFDDIQITEYVLPPLTTIRMSGRDIAASAVYALLNPGTAPKQVETSLVIRQTTGVPPRQTTAKPTSAKSAANTQSRPSRTGRRG